MGSPHTLEKFHPGKGAPHQKNFGAQSSLPFPTTRQHFQKVFPPRGIFLGGFVVGEGAGAAPTWGDGIRSFYGGHWFAGCLPFFCAETIGHPPYRGHAVQKNGGKKGANTRLLNGGIWPLLCHCFLCGLGGFGVHVGGGAPLGGPSCRRGRVRKNKTLLWVVPKLFWVLRCFTFLKAAAVATKCLLARACGGACGLWRGGGEIGGNFRAVG